MPLQEEKESRGHGEGHGLCETQSERERGRWHKETESLKLPRYVCHPCPAALLLTHLRFQCAQRWLAHQQSSLCRSHRPESAGEAMGGGGGDVEGNSTTQQGNSFHARPVLGSMSRKSECQLPHTPNSAQTLAPKGVEKARACASQFPSCSQQSPAQQGCRWAYCTAGLACVWAGRPGPHRGTWLAQEAGRKKEGPSREGGGARAGPQTQQALTMATSHRKTRVLNLVAFALAFSILKLPAGHGGREGKAGLAKALPPLAA